MIRIAIIYCFTVIFAITDSFSQRITIFEYIDTYSGVAVSEMHRSGIPASIKLAQGILESGFGNSLLATEGRNHFGIKCHNTWTGARIYHDDDQKGECFRKYNNASESWIDHTEFLVGGNRYAFLFEYELTDYKSWARGLSRAGYATDPNYPQRLIDLIERYNLHLYDTNDNVPISLIISENRANANTNNASQRDSDFGWFYIEQYPIYKNNKTDFILAMEGDTHASLANEMDIMLWQLLRFNDVKSSAQLYDGQRIYIQAKRRKATKNNPTHTVREGDTMYSISQDYAIKLKRLYFLNNMEEGSQSEVGNVLNLRKKAKK
jgi:LysM repeat protein